MIDIEKLSKKLNLSFVQTIEIRKNYNDLSYVASYKLNDEQMLLFVLANIDLDSQQAEILNKYKEDFNSLLKICSDLEMLNIKNNIKEENENALLVLCYKLLIFLIKKQEINLENVKTFIVETFDLLNKHNVYNALVQKFIFLKDLI